MVLRAMVHGGGKEISLSDYLIASDGDSPIDAVSNLAECLIDEYALAKVFGKTPFMDLIRTEPASHNETVNAGELGLPTAVLRALEDAERVRTGKQTCDT